MKNFFKKLSFLLSLILIIWFMQQNLATKALADINTGNSQSGTVVTNCVNTNFVNSPGTPCEVSNATPTPTPGGESVTPTPTPQGGGNNNNSNGGSVTSSSYCTDQKPNGIPLGLTAVAGPGAGQVTLTWGPPPGPFTTFSITYSDTPNTQKWGVADTGNVTLYTISGLSVGKYYFWVRAVNGCAQGDPAGPVSVQGTGGPLVLGAAISPTPAPKKEVLGKGTNTLQSAKTCGSCVWWPVIVAEILALIVYFWLIVKRKLFETILPRKYLWAVAVPVIAYLVFLYINRSCLGHTSFWYFINSSGFFCKYFILIDALTFGAVTFLANKYLNSQSKKA